MKVVMRPAIDRGELVAVLQEWRPVPLDVFIAYAASRQLSTKVRVFVEWESEIYARLERQTQKSGTDARERYPPGR